MKRRYEDWELAKVIADLIWACDGLDIPQRIRKFAAEGHEFCFSLGVHKDFASSVMQNTVRDGEVLKKTLFAIPDRARNSLHGTELRRRLLHSERGMKSHLIYATFLRERDGGQCYLAFRRNRSSKCIVYMLGWSE